MRNELKYRKILACLRKPLCVRSFRCLFCGVFFLVKMDSNVAICWQMAKNHHGISEPFPPATEAELRLARRQHQEALLCSLALRYAVGVEDDLPELPERTPSMDVEPPVLVLVEWIDFFSIT